MTSPIVELSAVSKDYHGLRPLRVETLTVAAGEHVAVLGLDRPMAEVLVNLLTGATLPDRGEVRIFGRLTAAIDNSAEWLSLVDRVGIVSERAVLLDRLSVIQNLAMPFTLDIEPPPVHIRDRAGALAREVALAESVWTRAVSELGPVDGVRVRLGRALALDPALVVLEHASAGVPRTDQTAVGAAFRAIVARRGSAMLALTAEKAFATAVAPRVLTLEPASGRLAEARGGFLPRLFGP